MADEFALDAHAVIWFIEGNPRFGARARAVIDALDSQLILPVIALTEAAFVVERGRTRIPSVEHLVERVEGDSRTFIAPLTRVIVRLSLGLRSVSEMHDRLIVATVLHLRAHGRSVVLLTRDQEITTSGLVPTLW